MRILHTVKFYAPSKGGMESVVKDIVEGISTINNDCFFSVYANSHIPNYSKIIKEESSNIKIIKEITPFLFKSQPLNYRYNSLRNLIKKNDVIHHHYPFPNMEWALWRNRDLLKGKKVIVTWHANIENTRWGFIKNVYDPFIEKILDFADHIVVTSPQLYESSNILAQFEKKIKVIPLSFNISFDSIGFPRLLDPIKRKKVLFVGKLRSYKGINYLIDAISLLNNVDLIIVGNGEEELKLKKQVFEKKLESRVKFLFNIQNSELIDIYKNADLFVLPSVNEAEAFGVVQLEAMACGLPVINTQLNSGVPFVSLDKITGYTVKPKDADQLSTAISKILEDKEIYETFSRNSIERASLFSREMLAKSYLELYNK